MEKSFNLLVIDTKEKFLNIINECQLPALALQMILKEVLVQVDNEVEKIIKNELIQYNKNLNEKGEMENDEC